MRVRPYGAEASIVDGLSHGAAALLREKVLRTCVVAGVVCIDVVPAATTLVVTHRAADGDVVRRLLGDLSEWRAPANMNDGELVEIAVRYDGIDLSDVASMCSISVDEVITLHGSAEYRVAFCGFAPGFAYLTGLPTKLHLARRKSPRPRVAAGAVAIAAHYSAVYPRESPGGWHLIGSADSVMWDLHRETPALLQPGMRVRFVRTA